MALPRSYEFWLAAYYLSRYGDVTGTERTASPPRSLGVEHWRDAYEAFFDSLSGGRDMTSFVRSLKNARDTFDPQTTGQPSERVVANVHAAERGR